MNTFSLEVNENQALLSTHTMIIMVIFYDYPSVTKTVNVSIIVQCSNLDLDAWTDPTWIPSAYDET